MLPELSELDSCFFAAGLGTAGLAAVVFAGAGFAVKITPLLDMPFKTLTLQVEKGAHPLPATFFCSSSSLLSEESLSLALLAAGAAGAFWTEAGGGTALYAPTNDQHHNIQHRVSAQLYNILTC